MRKIALVAACDRYNYGDVLLPIVFEEYCKKKNKKNFDFVYYALREANMEPVGGRKVCPLRDGAEADVVVFTGGEIMTVNYVTMHLHMNPMGVIKVVEKVFRKIPLTRGIINRLVGKLAFQRTSELPWIYFNEKQDIYYNSVGGYEFSKLKTHEKEAWKLVINNAKRFSVRDSKSFSEINKLLPGKCTLFPDTAILMDGIDIENKIRDKIRRMKEKQYYVIQMNRKVGKTAVSETVEAINKIYHRHNIACVLLVIGKASGHDDEVPLSKIHNLCNGTILIDDATIYEIMFVIKNAKCYIGSSLHGAITGMAYAVPHTALSENSEKLINYLTTWNTSKTVYVTSAEDIVKYVEKCVSGESCLNVDVISMMKNRVRELFDEIINDIEMAEGEI